MKRIEKNRRAGFSMTELLVVVAVVLILISLLFVVGGRMYGQSRLLQCQHHLEQIGRGLNMYSVGHQGRLPPPRSLSGRAWYETLAATHLDDGQVLGCPLIGPPPNVRVHAMQELEEEDMDAALEVLYWLRDQQEEDGRIPGSSYQQDIGHCAALLAFFTLDFNDRDLEFGDTIRKAVEYLTDSAQTPDGTYYNGVIDIGGSFSENLHTGYGVGGQMIANAGWGVMALSAAYQSLEDQSLRAKAGASARHALRFLDRITTQLVEPGQLPHGGYGSANWYDGELSGYSWPTPDDRDARTTTSIWAYLAVGSADRAGITIPSGLRSAVDRVMLRNAQGSAPGAMNKRWDPRGTSTGSQYRRVGTTASGRFTPYAFAMRTMMGESASHSVVRAQIQNNILYDDAGVPYQIKNFRDGQHRQYHFHTTLGLRLVGGDPWDKWREPNPSWNWQGYAHYVLNGLDFMGYDDEGNSMSRWPGDVQGGGWGFSGYGSVFSSGFSLIMLGQTHEDDWLNEDYVPAVERTASYGYNSVLGHTRATVPADTIMVMDYDNWLIQRGTGDPEEDDDDSRIALRHLGRANALMGDGSVRSLYLEEITPRGRWTLDRGD